jgi:hypothetical protein
LDRLLRGKADTILCTYQSNTARLIYLIALITNRILLIHLNHHVVVRRG